MKKKYKIIKDPKYGYFRLNPIPTRQELDDFYSRKFYSSEYKRFNDSSLPIQREERDFFISRWEAICAECLRHFGKIKNLSLIDIGCGFAQALLYFRQKGMRVTGLEPSDAGVDYAKSQKLNVFKANIEDISCIEGRKFDVVAMINVLEHFRNPAGILIDIKKKVLKQKGLLIIDVPNEFNDFQVVANQSFNLKEWWVYPPSHINYFSATTLKKLLVRCGYDIIHYEASFPLEIFMLMGDVYVGNTELGRVCHERRVKFEHLMRKYGKADKLRQIYKYFADLDLGRQVVIYAAKR